MLTLLFIWLAAGIALAFVSGRRSAGLPLAYFLGLSLIHVPGAILHLDAERSNWTRLGFEQTVIGIVAFLVAVMIARVLWSFFRSDRNTLARRSEDYADHAKDSLDYLGLLYCAIGGFTFLLVMPFAGAVPSATAILSSLGSLIIIGPCVRLWAARRDGNRFRYWSTIVFLPVLPLFTLVQAGFLGYGTYWVIAIVSFIFAQFRRRLLYICLAPMLFFVGLSVFVNYMAARDNIRNLVHQRASLSDRFDRVEDVFNKFEWLDFANVRQRRAIEGRLNQNLLVGAAIARLQGGGHEYAFGTTISDAIVGLIPRALWPDKPAVGGGGDVVTKYTGIRFAKGTSVGAGQVLEFYANFGTWGVISGYLIYGLLLGLLDLQIIQYLRQGDQKRFLLVFMIGTTLLQPGGNLLEIMVAAAGAVVGAFGVGLLIQRRWGAVGELHGNVST